MEDSLNWLLLAYKFAADGDSKGMRACARELFDADTASADGPGIMALAALYSGDDNEAEVLAEEALGLDEKNLNARLAMAGVFAARFELDKEIPMLRRLIKDAETAMRHEENVKKEMSFKLHMGRAIPDDERAFRQNTDAKMKILKSILLTAEGYLADALYLAADPDEAAKAILAASNLADDDERKAAYYSKYLFMMNYRHGAGAKSKERAMKFGSFYKNCSVYDHSAVKKTPDKKLRIGYISSDFRLHAAAYFFSPFVKNFNRENFIVHCYSRGTADAVTGRLRRFPIQWRDVRGRPAHTVARLIAEDHVDILVDLSGHTQNNCLDVMALRPAPVQMSAIGYINTTGLPGVDYFLSDKICTPNNENTAFTEEIIRLSCCHLCYAPGTVREMPTSGVRAPVADNGYVTFGVFNNFAKVTDEILCVWRGVMERVKDSRLIIKGKICSVPSGQKILLQRLKNLSFDISRIELRPFSPNYLEEYRDIDIALDTMPYNGGLTTCEALFMGVPVVTMRGRSHGSRFGASILYHADLNELVAENQMEYVKKILQLSGNKDILQRYHSGLREHLKKSSLMDAKNYMLELEAQYRAIWRKFCESR